MPSEEQRDEQRHSVTTGAAEFVDRLDDEVMGFIDDLGGKVRNLLQAMLDRGSDPSEACMTCINVVISIAMNEVGPKQEGDWTWHGWEPENDESTDSD